MPNTLGVTKKLAMVNRYNKASQMNFTARKENTQIKPFH